LPADEKAVIEKTIRDSIGWKDTRWTGVLEKRNGKWLIVQMHFSFASDKVAAEVKAKLALHPICRQ
jgi:hypothetical protein